MIGRVDIAFVETNVFSALASVALVASAAPGDVSCGHV
jgi:hypothetical protein